MEESKDKIKLEEITAGHILRDAALHAGNARHAIVIVVAKNHDFQVQASSRIPLPDAALMVKLFENWFNGQLNNKTAAK